MHGFQIEYLMLAKSFHFRPEIICELEPDAFVLLKICHFKGSGG